MNDNIKSLLKEIRYSYTSLQMSIYFDFYIKVDNGINKTLSVILDGIEHDINFDNGKRYLLRKDYIKYGLETSINKTLNWGILGDMAIIQSFSYITNNFKELLDNEESFKKFALNLFTEKEYDYNTFYSILSLIRNISTHGSISKNYTLKEKDFKVWKKYHLDKGIHKLDLHLNIIDELHRLDLSININEINIGYNFSNILGTYEMLMLIELCMNLIDYYEKNKLNK